MWCWQGWAPRNVSCSHLTWQGIVHKSEFGTVQNNIWNRWCIYIYISRIFSFILKVLKKKTITSMFGFHNLSRFVVTKTPKIYFNKKIKTFLMVLSSAFSSVLRSDQVILEIASLPFMNPASLLSLIQFINRPPAYNPGSRSHGMLIISSCIGGLSHLVKSNLESETMDFLTSRFVRDCRDAMFGISRESPLKNSTKLGGCDDGVERLVEEFASCIRIVVEKSDLGWVKITQHSSWICFD